MVDMPKSKPTQVIVHRIELQTKEREMLEALVVSKSINNIVSPVLNNVAPIATAYIAYQAAKETADWLPNAIDRTSTVLANFLQPSYNRLLRRSQTYNKKEKDKQEEEGGWWATLAEGLDGAFYV
jgi:hypothetical protein